MLRLSRRLPHWLPPRLSLSTHSTQRSLRQLSTATPALVPFRTHPSLSPTTPLVHTFFHSTTSTWTYLLVCPSPSPSHTKQKAAIIVSVLDFNPSTNQISTESADGLLAYVQQQGLQVQRVMETHAHADHLTAAAYLRSRLSPTPRLGASAGIQITQAHFAKVFDTPRDELQGAFDELYEDGETVQVGEMEGRVMHLPGHTACSAAFVFGDYVFVGDTIFLPKIGSARTDFPSGSAHSLYLSSQKLLSLPSSTRLFSGHNYLSPSSSSSNACSATVAEQLSENKHLRKGVKEEEFVGMREERDRGLGEPGLLWQSLQVNIRAGRLPRGKDGKPFLRLPLYAPEGFP
ncbi:hypothetical protein JCM11641_001632 [Rhodosporidiobolus odoratus]